MTSQLIIFLRPAAVVYDLAKPHEKERILRVIFSELTLSKTTLDYKCKKGFIGLQSRFVASCDQFTWLSELSKYSTLFPSDIQMLEAILAK